MSSFYGDADLTGLGMPTAGAADDEIRAATHDRARRNLAVIALDQPDPEDWLRVTLGALGLLNTTRRAPGTCRSCGGNLSNSPQLSVDRQRRNRGLCLPCDRAEEAV